MGVPWEAWGHNSKPGSQVQSTRAGKRCLHNISLWKSVEILYTRERGECARDTGTLIKGQCIKYHSQPLTLGSCGGREKQVRVMWGEMGVCGPGERVKGRAQQNLCWVTLPHHKHHVSWVEYSPPYSINLGECNSSPTLWSLHLAENLSAWAMK